jgi:elongation factor P hydroxylase
MATARVGPEGMKPRSDDWVELKAPEQFQFSKEGDMVEGVLISIEPVEIKGKQAIEYMFARANGDRFTCLGTNDLNKKITPSNLGYPVRIRYESTDSSFQKAGQSPMKIFKVQVKPQKAPGFEHLGIVS